MHFLFRCSPNPNLNTNGLASQKTDVEQLKANFLRLDMRVEQLERTDRGAKGGR